MVDTVMLLFRLVFLVTSNFSLPCKGDLLIHGGDFTWFGKEEHLKDFNEWLGVVPNSELILILGTLPHKHKIIVNGNHESNAPWKKVPIEITL